MFLMNVENTRTPVVNLISLDGASSRPAACPRCGGTPVGASAQLKLPELTPAVVSVVLKAWLQRVLTLTDKMADAFFRRPPSRMVPAILGTAANIRLDGQNLSAAPLKTYVIAAFLTGVAFPG
jgi:hypothetical protein